MQIKYRMLEGCEGIPSLPSGHTHFSARSSCILFCSGIEMSIVTRSLAL